jgi:hypothetical protein
VRLADQAAASAAAGAAALGAQRPWESGPARTTAAPEAAQTSVRIPQQAAAPAHEEAPPAAPGTVSPAAAARGWSSPGDDGWRAAQALSEPAHDGQTASGLPRRTPRANLVPGSAGGKGAARAVPPPNLRQDPSQGGRQ